MFIYKINDKMSFGMYEKEGKTLLDIALTNPSYIEFNIKNTANFCISLDALKMIIKKVPKFRLSKQAFAINIKKLNLSRREEFGGLHIKKKSNNDKSDKNNECERKNDSSDSL